MSNIIRMILSAARSSDLLVLRDSDSRGGGEMISWSGGGRTEKEEEREDNRVGEASSVDIRENTHTLSLPSSNE